MPRVRRRSAAVLASGLLALSVAMSGTASAHEGRKVGAYMFVVGWGDEPAYAGSKNSVQLFLSTAADDKPVVDLGDTLKVAVEKDGQSLPLEVEPDFEVGEFGTPGDYRAWLFPTRPGSYTFHFTGTVKGQRVDESFTSKPTGFSEVEAPTDKQFPVKDPSTADLGTRLDRELPRLTTSVADQGRALDAKVRDARDAANQARIIGLAGLVVGVAGVGLAVNARRSRA